MDHQSFRRGSCSSTHGCEWTFDVMESDATIAGRFEFAGLERGHLVAVLCNPPLTSSGMRTSARVELARQLLEYRTVESVNLFSTPTRSSGDIANIGTDADTWMVGRPAIDVALRKATGVLLAYGVSEPTGAARNHWRSQIAWLEVRLERSAAVVWQLGPQPHHPSRWQRWTHRNYPDLSFRDSVARGLQRANCF